MRSGCSSPSKGYQLIRLMVVLGSKINRRLLCGVPAREVEIDERILMHVKANLKNLMIESNGKIEKFGS